MAKCCVRALLLDHGKYCNFRSEPVSIMYKSAMYNYFPYSNNVLWVIWNILGKQAFGQNFSCRESTFTCLTPTKGKKSMHLVKISAVENLLLLSLFQPRVRKVSIWLKFLLSRIHIYFHYSNQGQGKYAFGQSFPVSRIYSNLLEIGHSV